MITSKQKTGANAELIEKFQTCLGLVSLGIRVTEACKKTGLSRNTFYWLKNKAKHTAQTKEAS
jgi:DNA invertase Pin-like site-specific DNA recombinase